MFSCGGVQQTGGTPSIAPSWDVGIVTMGLTIHYGLRSDAISPEQARQQVEQLRQAALDLAMSEVGEVVDIAGTAYDLSTAKDESLRWLLVQARRMVSIGKTFRLLVPIRVFAFSAWPGDECEVASFGLAIYPDTIETEEGTLSTGLSGWSWGSFCKTQYASNPDVGGVANFVRCHLAVIRLLDQAKVMGVLESVKDESHFWEDRDVKALAETVGKWNVHIAGLVGQYYDRTGGNIVAPIIDYPNFEHLEADGQKEERDE